MKIIHILTFIFLFLLIASISYYFVLAALSNRIISKRLGDIRIHALDEANPRKSRLEDKAKYILAKLIHYSMPDESWDDSKIRLRFMSAGYYRELDALIYFGLKTLLTFVLPILYVIITLIFGSGITFISILAIAVFMSCLGYYLPDLWIAEKIKARKKEIFESLPNALDLMRVCVTAGLGLDAAIERVGKELRIESKALAEEFHLLNLELRTGATRKLALKNLADRTGVEDVHSLVSMLIQTEHCGTSIADALRVHADSLREKRSIMAQEAAAAIPVKMTIPLIACIFPALMVVLLGPAIISVSKALSTINFGVH